ncbi:hypothetical protein ACQ4PT_048923 [Festuca glaucescens]
MDWYPGSLLPPDVDEDADADPPNICLLDRKPFLGKRTNPTTARYCITNDDVYDDMTIQVTFFAGRPPRVSYILAWSFGTYFTDEPLVVSTSTDGGLVLLSVAIYSDRFRFSEYYLYQPGGSGTAAPSLDLVPQPSGRRLVDELCIASLPPHGGGYHVDILTMEESGEFDLYVFSSDTQTWTLKKPVLLREDDEAAALADEYMTYKAVAHGGGALAFVDFWNGILICDVLDGGERPELHYLPLPSTGLCQPSPSCYLMNPREIAINVSSDTICIKLAEVMFNSGAWCGAWCADTWTATTMAKSPWRQLKGWHKESTDGTEISVADGISLAGLLDLEHGDGEPRTLGYLFVDRPMLSLDQRQPCVLRG